MSEDQDCQGCGEAPTKEPVKPLQMTPDMDLAVALRKNFTARSCTEALLQAVSDMAAAIGVEVSWEIRGVNEDVDVDRDALTKALGRMSTAGGAMLVGGKVNPITSLAAQNPMRLIQDRKKNA